MAGSKKKKSNKSPSKPSSGTASPSASPKPTAAAATAATAVASAAPATPTITPSMAAIMASKALEVIGKSIAITSPAAVAALSASTPVSSAKAPTCGSKQQPTADSPPPTDYVMVSSSSVTPTATHSDDDAVVVSRSAAGHTKKKSPTGAPVMADKADFMLVKDKAIQDVEVSSGSHRVLSAHANQWETSHHISRYNSKLSSSGVPMARAVSPAKSAAPSKSTSDAVIQSYEVEAAMRRVTGSTAAHIEGLNLSKAHTPAKQQQKPAAAGTAMAAANAPTQKSVSNDASVIQSYEVEAGQRRITGSTAAHIEGINLTEKNSTVTTAAPKAKTGTAAATTSVPAKSVNSVTQQSDPRVIEAAEAAAGLTRAIAAAAAHIEGMNLAKVQTKEAQAQPAVSQKAMKQAQPAAASSKQAPAASPSKAKQESTPKSVTVATPAPATAVAAAAVATPSQSVSYGTAGPGVAQRALKKLQFSSTSPAHTVESLLAQLHAANSKIKRLEAELASSKGIRAREAHVSFVQGQRIKELEAQLSGSSTSSSSSSSSAHPTATTTTTTATGQKQQHGLITPGTSPTRSTSNANTRGATSSSATTSSSSKPELVASHEAKAGLRLALASHAVAVESLAVAKKEYNVPKARLVSVAKDLASVDASFSANDGGEKEVDYSVGPSGRKGSFYGRRWEDPVRGTGWKVQF